MDRFWMAFLAACVAFGGFLARGPSPMGVVASSAEARSRMGAECYEYDNVNQSYCYNSGQCNGGCGCKPYPKLKAGTTALNIAQPCNGNQQCTDRFTLSAFACGT